MLIVRWNEDKEGCLFASWYDDDRIEHGDFVEPVMNMDEFILFKLDPEEMSVLDGDEDYELELAERPCFGLAACR